MFKIIGNNIYLSRGDTASPCVKIRSTSGDYYRLSGVDRLTFTLKKNCEDSNAILVKTNPTEVTEVVGGQTIYKYIFTIEKSDTMSLDFGDYVYDIRLDYTSGAGQSSIKRCTIVEPSIFKIKEVVSDA